MHGVTIGESRLVPFARAKSLIMGSAVGLRDSHRLAVRGRSGLWKLRHSLPHHDPSLVDASKRMH